MRIPFDSLTLAAVVHELQPFVGAKVQRISQLDEHTVVLGLFGAQGEAYLLLSCDPVFFRLHFVTKRPTNLPQPPQFCAAMRSRLDQARLRHAMQVGFDRIAWLDFEGAEGVHFRLVAELMGKHSNLVLIEGESKIVGVAKPIGPSKSVRPILPGRSYSPPPLPARPSILEAKEGDDLSQTEGASPFLQKLLGAQGQGALDKLKTTVRASGFHPVLVPGSGAYPVSVAALGVTEFPRQSISIALEGHFASAEPAYHASQLRASLLSQLSRVLLSREAAIDDLEQAQDAAKRASHLQLQGELILAHGLALLPGASSLETVDYDGMPVTIRLVPELNYLDNAGRFFGKAKKAKSRQGLVADQLQRLSKERADVQAMIERVEAEERLESLRDLQAAARDRKWLFQQFSRMSKKAVQPYEGHRIRELMGPGGATVLYGENAISNDYLTLRVAKPDDYWLHVRGAASAHVVIRTDRKPERIGREALLFAAKIAVQNSPSKHAGLVPVDYTLRKYVRKPKGAQPGAALYTHEKTLHVEKP